MKSNTISKALRLSALLLIPMVIVTSCDNKTAKPTEDSAAQAAKENDVKFDNKKEEKDAKFLVDAAAFYLEQMRLDEAARTKGGKDVKALANTLEADHTKSLKAVQDMAKNKQVSIPDSSTAEAFTTYQTLSGKAGKEFDKTYCSDVVDSYKKSVTSFEKEATDSRDQDIKDWAKTELPNIRKQLDSIFDCQKKVEKL